MQRGKLGEDQRPGLRRGGGGAARHGLGVEVWLGCWGKGQHTLTDGPSGHLNALPVNDHHPVSSALCNIYHLPRQNLGQGPFSVFLSKINIAFGASC